MLLPISVLSHLVLSLSLPVCRGPHLLVITLTPFTFVDIWTSQHRLDTLRSTLEASADRKCARLKGAALQGWESSGEKRKEGDETECELERGGREENGKM